MQGQGLTGRRQHAAQVNPHRAVEAVPHPAAACLPHQRLAGIDGHRAHRLPARDVQPRPLGGRFQRSGRHVGAIPGHLRRLAGPRGIAGRSARTHVRQAHLLPGCLRGVHAVGCGRQPTAVPSRCWATPRFRFARCAPAAGSPGACNCSATGRSSAKRARAAWAWQPRAGSCAGWTAARRAHSSSQPRLAALRTASARVPT